MKFSRKFIAILVGALVLRLALLYVDYSWDVNNHISWAEDLVRYGFHEKFFSTISTHVFGSLYPNYPPLALYLFYLIYPIHPLAHSVTWWANVTFPVFPSQLVFFVENKTFLAGIFKLPSILADFGIVWLLFLFSNHLVKKNPEKNLLFISVAYLFNPIVFYNSAFWGQIDALNLFFVLAAIYLAMFSKRTIASCLLFTVALLIKPNPIIFVPVFLYILVKKHSMKRVVIGGVASMMFFYVAYLPFLDNPSHLLAPFTLYWEKAVLAQSLSQVSNSAYNFWTVILSNTGISDQTHIVGFMTYRLLGYLLFALSLVGIFIGLRHNANFNRAVIYALFFSAICSFLFLTKMHERYVILFIPFLILMVLENRKLLPLFIILTILGFLNMYNSWPVPRIAVLKMVVESVWGAQWIAVGILLCSRYIFFEWRKRKFPN